MRRLITGGILILLLLSFSASQLKAGAAKLHAPAVVHIDTTGITARMFNAGAIKKFNSQKDFQYKPPPLQQASFWTRFWTWIWEKIAELFNLSSTGKTIFKYFLLALGVGFLLYILLKTLGIDAFNRRPFDLQQTNLQYTESLENIHEINFDEEIEQAISQLNYRLAVRLLYLKCLKQLSDTNLIHWQIDKTNTAYLHELKDPSQKQSFELLTRKFEYAWYGGFLINAHTFENINQLFQRFKNQLP